MINQRFRLVDTQNLRTDYIEEEVGPDDIVVRPLYMSICAADQRYYQGMRPRKIMKKKLPLALIHEAVGVVLYDPSGKFERGSHVVLLPNKPTENDEYIKENYRRTSKFSGSSQDGFMQSFVVTSHENVVDIEGIKLEIASLIELMSVSMNAIDHFDKHRKTKNDVIGVWGDGSVGYITALILKALYPDSKIVVCGKRPMKLEYFTFVDETYTVDNLPEDFYVDHAFECVGGNYSANAINQIIDYIKPQGTISLLGVSEEPVDINTRMVLEKGLILIGDSRSGREDFENVVKLLKENKEVESFLSTVISDLIEIRTVHDIHLAFSKDMDNEFKTVMKWEI